MTERIERGARLRTDFGFRDKWSRKVGMAHWTMQRKYTDANFGYYAHAARDGQTYGSSASINWHATAEERDAALIKLIARSAKSARKRLTATKKIHPEDAQ